MDRWYPGGATHGTYKAGCPIISNWYTPTLKPIVMSTTTGATQHISTWSNPTQQEALVITTRPMAGTTGDVYLAERRLGVTVGPREAQGLRCPNRVPWNSGGVGGWVVGGCWVVVPGWVVGWFLGCLGINDWNEDGMI